MSPEISEAFEIETKTELARHEIRITNLECSVKDIKALTEATSELAVSLKNVNEKIDVNQKNIEEKIDMNQKNTNEKIEDLTNSVKEIVDKPKKDLVVLRTAIISSVGGAIGTAIAAWLFSVLK